MPIATRSNIGSPLIHWGISLFALAALAVFAPFDPILNWTGLIGSMGFSLALAVYYGWILLRRLQCSLLELWFLIAMLGIVEGLLVSAPGLLTLGSPLLSLVPLSAAWILGGAVKAMAQARLFDLHHVGARIGLIFANWFSLASPALLLVGLTLYFGRGINDALVSRTLAGAGLPLFIAGGVGLVVYIALEIFSARAARRVTKAVRFTVSKI
jgi:hypothetical protein